MSKRKTDINTDEARVEMYTAVLLIFVAAGFMFGGLNNNWAMLAAGLILLGSGGYQASRGWHVGIPTWILGGVLTLGGMGTRMFLVTYTNINFVALTLIGVAVYLFFNTVRR